MLYHVVYPVLSVLAGYSIATFRAMLRRDKRAAHRKVTTVQSAYLSGADSHPTDYVSKYPAVIKGEVITDGEHE